MELTEDWETISAEEERALFDTYSVEKVYMRRSRDSNGHSSKTNVEGSQVKVDPALAGLYASIATHKGTPYKGLQDFYRDAAMHRAKHWLVLLRDPELIADFREVRLEMGIVTEHERHERRSELLGKLERLVAKYIEVGDPSGALDYLADVEQAADGWPAKLYRQAIKKVEGLRRQVRDAIEDEKRTPKS